MINYYFVAKFSLDHIERLRADASREALVRASRREAAKTYPAGMNAGEPRARFVAGVSAEVCEGEAA